MESTKHFKEANIFLSDDNRQNYDEYPLHTGISDEMNNDLVPDNDLMCGRIRKGGPQSGRGGDGEGSTNHTSSSTTNSDPNKGSNNGQKDVWRCDVTSDNDHGSFDPTKDDLYKPLWFGVDTHSEYKFCYHHAFQVTTCQLHTEPREHDIDILMKSSPPETLKIPRES